MHLIVAEKNISAERIARILAGRQSLSTKKERGVSTYTFDETVVVGLKGHVVEVDFEPGYTDWRSEKHTPRSLIDAGIVKTPTEPKIVSLIQKLAKRADRVTIATDYDTEGELIGKEAYELIRQVNGRVKVDRARFSAITPQELSEAFSRTTDLDFDLAAAGEARQVIDLVWGASLTRFISLAAHRGGSNILSVGRVQSPTLAMIVDREKEIAQFVPMTYWQLHLATEKAGQVFEARHLTARFDDHAEALRAKEQTREPLTVTEVALGEKQDRPPAPFDTTTFIVAAGRLGFSAARAMNIAEDLYMNGFISYPRTDNTVYPSTLNLRGILDTLRATEFREHAEWVAAHLRPQPTRGKKVSTDHPPIHPAGAARREQIGDDRWRIYELVVRRFLATLAPDARWSTVKCRLSASGEPYAASGARLLDAGWRMVYPFSAAEEHLLPPLSVGDLLPIREVVLEEKQTQPPARYSQSRLIQRMEELGLGTKSTRHEVIGKLLSRRYVEGNPLRPTLVGTAVIETLEGHADTITKPDMTRTLESHMQMIKERGRRRDDVVSESRTMLHRAFDQLEAHGDQIGDELRGRTDEERVIGKCPSCGGDLRICAPGGASQFIGCKRYPECSFNINLPGTTWGRALRVDTICPDHNLHHVRLVRKGARPWEIGCPLCSHISSNVEALREMPHMTDDLLAKLHKRHIYTVSEIASGSPEGFSDILGIGLVQAAELVKEAKDVLEVLRKRSALRSFIRKNVPPRRGRSISELMKRLCRAGINDLSALAGADASALVKCGLSEKEAAETLHQAHDLCSTRILRESGVPAVSLKKYQEAGVADPEAFCTLPAPYLSQKTGIKLDTVYRHAEKVCQHLRRETPKRIPQAAFDRGRAELLSLPNLGEATLERLYRAGVTDAASLAEADPEMLAEKSGIPPAKLQEYRAALAGHSGGAARNLAREAASR